MSFTTPCFIRKNTPELRNKLRHLGCKVFPNILNFPCLSAGDGLATPADNINRNGGYDCGTNESLFLAIAALRDDDILDRWYWYKNRLFRCVGTGSTVCMDGHYSLKLKTELGWFETMDTDVVEATIPELVEHFKAEE